MIDAPVRRQLGAWLAPAGRWLGRAGVTPNALTIAGAALGVVAALLVARGAAWLALGTWLVSRFVDALDGIVAREAGLATPFGGYLDITLDMIAYGAMVLGFAAVHPAQRWLWPAVLFGYLLVTTTTLALSSILEARRAVQPHNDRSLQFTAGYAEAGETSVVYALFTAWPAGVAYVGWAWVAVCAATVVQRTVLARRLLA
jgi:phosphatidylglycerophosphate synthase